MAHFQILLLFGNGAIASTAFSPPLQILSLSVFVFSVYNRERTVLADRKSRGKNSFSSLARNGSTSLLLLLPLLLYFQLHFLSLLLIETETVRFVNTLDDRHRDLGWTEGLIFILLKFR